MVVKDMAFIFNFRLIFEVFEKDEQFSRLLHYLYHTFALLPTELMNIVE